MNDSRNTIVGTACLLMVGLLGWSLGGCDLITDGSADQTGTLEMLLTDAPFPFDAVAEASVTITRIEVRQSSSDPDGTSDELANDAEEGADGNENADDVNDNGDGNGGTDDGNNNENGDVDPAQGTENDNANDNGDQTDNGNDNGDTDEALDGDGDTDDVGDGSDDADDDGSFVTVLEEEVTFNLLDLQGGVMASLASAELAIGTYSQARLIVSSGHVTLTDGREFDLTVPSGEQTGIKLNFDFSITTNDTTTLLVDMDVSKAFVPIPGGDVNDASQIQSFTFKPSQSIRIVKIDATGSVSGVVMDESGDPISGVTVTASRDGQEITTTATTDDGAFAMSGLEPGTYELQFSKTGFEDQSLSSLEVTAGSDTSVDDVTLSAVAAGT